MLRGIVAAALLCTLAPVAWADNKEAAKQAYTEGKRQYDLGEYGVALDAFKRAYLNYEEPVFLFNIAQCYRALGDRPAAVRTYRAFLRNWPKAPNKEQVERIVAELEAAIAQDQSARAAPPDDTMPPRTVEAPKTPPPATTTPAPTPPAEKPTVAMTTPTPTSPPPTATTTEPPTATTTPPPPVAKRPPPKDDAMGMVEVEPNFDRPSGSSKPLKWWAWTLITLGIGGAVAAAVAIGITESGTAKFATTLPQFNVTKLTRVFQVSF